MNCLMCNDRLDQIHYDAGVHPGCEDQQAHRNDLANGLRADLMQMIHWADKKPMTASPSTSPSRSW